MYLFSFDLDIRELDFRKIKKYKDLHESVRFMNYAVDFIRSRIFIDYQMKFRDWDTLLLIETPRIFVASSFVKDQFEADFWWAMADKHKTFSLVYGYVELIREVRKVYDSIVWDKVISWLYRLNRVLAHMLPDCVNMTKRQHDVISIVREAGDYRSPAEILKDVGLIEDRGHNFYDLNYDLVVLPRNIDMQNLRKILHKSPPKVVNIIEEKIENPFKGIKRSWK